MERGLRRILNFGHTLGHAVEAASGYGLSHGEGRRYRDGGSAKLRKRWVIWHRKTACESCP